MSSQRPDRIKVTEEAARWMSAVQDAPESRAALFNWLKESPHHVEELLFAMSLTDSIAALSREQRQSIESQGRSRADTAMPNVRQLQTGSKLEQRHRLPAAAHVKRRRRFIALAAGLAVVAVSGWFLQRQFTWQTYTTAVGEQRTIELEDGSVVYLNTGSQLKIHFSGETRELHLMEGEALFKVQRAAERPFRVITRDAVTQALGTEFNVYRRPNATTTVSVVEGAVRCEARDVQNKQTLTAGEEVNITSKRIVKHTAPDVAKVTAWRHRRLVFHGDTLADIAAEFNRYNRSIKIRVEGDLARRHFAGTFDADAPEAFAQTLRTDQTLIVERRQSEILIRARN